MISDDYGRKQIQRSSVYWGMECTYELTKGDLSTNPPMWNHWPRKSTAIKWKNVMTSTNGRKLLLVISRIQNWRMVNHTTDVSSIRCGLFRKQKTVNWKNSRIIPKGCQCKRIADLGSTSRNWTRWGIGQKTLMSLVQDLSGFVMERLYASGS